MMRRYEIIPCPTEDAWLHARRNYCCASESAIVLGEGYADQSPLTVWDEKVHGPRETDDGARRKRLRIGQIMQPAIQQVFEEEKGLKTEATANQLWVSIDHPFLAASLDAEAIEDGERIPVELKAVSQFNSRDWDDEPPLKFQIQMQHQLAVTGAPYGYLMGFIGGFEPVIRKIERHEEFIALLIERLADFWRYVQERMPPPVDASIATSKALSRLYPRDAGTEIVLPEEAAIWDAERCQAEMDEDEARVRRMEAENKLKAAMGDNAVGLLPSGASYSWKTQQRKGYTVAASECRVFRRHKQPQLKGPKQCQLPPSKVS